MPLSDIAAALEGPAAGTALPEMSSVVLPVRRKMSRSPSVSAAARLEPSDSKATVVPSGLMTGLKESPFAAAPAVDRLIRIVVPVCVSRRYTFLTLSLSSGTSPSASDSNTTKRPSAETAWSPASLLFTGAGGSAPSPLGRLRSSVAPESAASASAGTSAASATTARTTPVKRLPIAPRYVRNARG